jgi:hypothetical protein
MTFPTKVCIICEEEFELKPDHPGYANRCRDCNNPEKADAGAKTKLTAEEQKSLREANEERRAAMKNLLYRKDS